ncbi:hypothetical protein [Clostridium manihotivorum]|uniref:Uncharacterized protein n=1 Tax=Clostridium manihotivorum TaxID=2320868 RepID=A0A3R5U945_9CLOT|nr:hypothetical protein [Clostridium manihotivorum]QAA32473.1 hypothetical protein C1I91_12940 [Clostridium manihotivorum]
MKSKRILVLGLIIIILGLLSVAFSIFSAFLAFGIVCIAHGCLMIFSKEYKRIIVNRFFRFEEDNLKGREEFYKSLGVNENNNVNRFFNSSIVVGFIAIAQALINYKALKNNASITAATIVCVISFISFIIIGALNDRIVKKSKDYSEYHMRFILLVTFIAIPIMFFGLIWILSTKGIVM